MDGFIAQAAPGSRPAGLAPDPLPARRGGPTVMGYNTAADIPNYWTYAHQFVLQDHMFEPTRRGACRHLFLVSGWSARCCRCARPA